MVAEKRCRVCGADVAQVKRVKDGSGTYYCDPCAQALRNHQAGQQGTDATKNCANCGTTVGALQQLWDWQGHAVCWTCREILKSDAEQRQREQVVEQKLPDTAIERSAAVTERPDAGKRSVGLNGAYLMNLVAIVLVTVAFLGLPVFGTVAGFQAGGLIAGTDSIVASIGGWMGLAVGLTCSVGVVVWARAIDKGKCPKCGLWLKSVVERSDLLGQSAVTMRSTETVHVREGQNTFGPVVANLRVPSERTVIVNQYAVHRRCKNCGHRWTTS